ncbi:hypothetical protein PVL29_025151 [Vitis rotundifolia]|uniref:SWIM-type domain-containing protein n=1 Tax=Vitis rotundifolia TaxID=103349 RepID=A0AA39D6S7_VITRO|nr:hypothetical protein PVL29_025151 [Vitis rotundifolia]
MTGVGKRLYCFCHWGGKRKIDTARNVTYEGGITVAVLLTEGTSYNAFVPLVCEHLGIDPKGKVLYYSAKLDKTQYICLKNDSQLKAMLELNDEIADVYVAHADGVLRCSNPALQQIPVESGANGYVDHANDGSSGSSSNIAMQPIPNRSNEEPNTNLCGNDIMASIPKHIENSPLVAAMHKKAILEKGQLFDSPEEFQSAVEKYSLENNFEYRVKDNSYEYMSARCKVDGCPWKVTAVCEGNTRLVMVKRFINIHKHSVQDQMGCKLGLSSNLASGLIVEKPSADPSSLSKRIHKDQSDFDVEVNYQKLWRARKKAKEAINGKPEDSYKLIPWMCKRLIESIPGTVAKWTCSDENKFRQLFVAYGCSITGFHNGCRELLFVDAYHLSGPYKDTLLSASALDADDGLYPLAYGVVNTDNDENWLWFLEHLKSILMDRHVVLVSDRNPSFLSAANKVFGSDYNAHCLNHLKESLDYFISSNPVLKMGTDKKKIALKLLNDIAYARTADKYEATLGKMRLLKEELYDWVVSTGPEHWANSLFPGRRWDKIFTSQVESFNRFVQEERDLPVIGFITSHRLKLSELLLRKQSEVAKWETPVGGKIEMKIKENQNLAVGLNHHTISPTNMEVYENGETFAVALDMKSCSCREWEMTGIPCRHACCAVTAANTNIYDYVEKCYMKETQEQIYASNMPSVPIHDMPTLSELHGNDPNSLVGSMSILHPPPDKRPPGRPRKKEIDSQLQDKRKLHCSRCHKAGHNRSTCKEQPSC